VFSLDHRQTPESGTGAVWRARSRRDTGAHKRKFLLFCTESACFLTVIFLLSVLNPHAFLFDLYHAIGPPSTPGRVVDLFRIKEG